MAAQSNTMRGYHGKQHDSGSSVKALTGNLTATHVIENHGSKAPPGYLFVDSDCGVKAQPHSDNRGHRNSRLASNYLP